VRNKKGERNRRGDGAQSQNELISHNTINKKMGIQNMIGAPSSAEAQKGEDLAK